MSFMLPYLEQGHYYEIETTAGTWVVPADLLGPEPMPEDVKDYVEGRPEPNEDDEGNEIPYESKYGWLCRMSAPGYMDCTDWAAFDTEKEALEFLLDMYGTQDDGPEEDWEEEVKERITELEGQS